MMRSLNNSINTSIIVAGNGTGGSASNMLYQPQGIFVDSNLTLYVADSHNNRIQLFRAGQLNGNTIVVTGSSGFIPLNNPTDVLLDADGYLFIVDQYNNRIIGSGSNGFRCLVGCFGNGSGPNQLFAPSTLSFDSYGNMFVTDSKNNRIQKFLLATNSCGKCNNISLCNR